MAKPPQPSLENRLARALESGIEIYVEARPGYMNDRYGRMKMIHTDSEVTIRGVKPDMVEPFLEAVIKALEDIKHDS